VLPFYTNKEAEAYRDFVLIHRQGPMDFPIETFASNTGFNGHIIGAVYIELEIFGKIIRFYLVILVDLRTIY